MQVNGGLVRVVDTDATVQHIWELNLVGLIGAAPVFSIGDAVTWPGSGAGTVTSWDASAQVLRLYRTGGTTGPAEGETITNTTQAGKSGDVDSRGPDSPPGWPAALAGEPIKKFSAGAGSLYDVSATVNEDNLELTAPWADGSQNETPYGIQIDWLDPVRLALFEIGDVDVLAFLSESMAELNRQLTFRGAMLGLDTPQAVILSGTFTRILWDATRYDENGTGLGWVFADAINGDRFEVPVGIARVVCTGAIIASAIVGTPNWFSLRVLINGAAGYEGYMQPKGDDRMSITTPPLSVVAGDNVTLEAEMNGGTSFTLAANAQQHFTIRALELT